MSSRHLVDPELLPLIDSEVKLSLSTADLAAARALLPQFYIPFGPSPAKVTQQRIPSLDGETDIGLVIHAPHGPSEKRGAIFYIHGGGMVLGDAYMRQGIDGARAVRWNTVIVSVDYRVAPETPFPGAIEDSYSGLVWLFDNADALGIDPARIAIMGDSAGGGLAASLAQLARDRHGPQACAQILIYPMLDFRTGSDSDPYRNPITGEFAWTRAHNQFGWRALRGDYGANDDRAGHFSACLASNLQKLPPAALFVGSLDLFFDESLDYGRRLCVAGVPLELHTYAGAIHGFDILSEAAVARQFERDLTNAVTRLLAR